MQKLLYLCALFVKNMILYDYLIVGAGLFGAKFAHMAKKAGKSCLVIDKRPHWGGNVYCETIEGIHVHKYGAHIFHTSNKEVWDFVNALVPFNRYTNSPIANYKGELYNLPFNMHTFHQMWGVQTPEEAKAKIDEQRAEIVSALNGRDPQNLSLRGWKKQSHGSRWRKTGIYGTIYTVFGQGACCR